jgi:hypothetical protein
LKGKKGIYKTTPKLSMILAWELQHMRILLEEKRNVIAAMERDINLLADWLHQNAKEPNRYADWLQVVRDKRTSELEELQAGRDRLAVALEKLQWVYDWIVAAIGDAPIAETPLQGLRRYGRLSPWQAYP